MSHASLSSASRVTALAAALFCCAVQAAPAEDDARALRNYKLHCMGCHLADGSGAPAKGIPTMRDALGKFLWTPGGRQFIVQVPGVMHTPLRDAEVAELMNWLLRTVSPSTVPTGTAPYTADEITRLRATRPVDIPGTRRQLVQDLARRGIGIE